MPRPKKKGPLIPLRLSDEATEELFRRADGAGVTPREYLVAHIEGILSLTLDEPGLGPTPPPSQKLAVKMEKPPELTKPRVGDFLGLVRVSTIEAREGEPLPCRHWRKRVENGKTICLQCGVTL